MNEAVSTSWLPLKAILLSGTSLLCGDLSRCPQPLIGKLGIRLSDPGQINLWLQTRALDTNPVGSSTSSTSYKPRDIDIGKPLPAK